MQPIADFLVAFASTPDGHATILLLVAVVALLFVRIGVGILLPFPSYNPSAITAFLVGLAALALWVVPPWGLAVSLTGLILGLRSRGSWHKGLALAGAILSFIGLAVVIANLTVGIYHVPAGTLRPFLPVRAPEAGGAVNITPPGQLVRAAGSATAAPTAIAGCLNWTQITLDMHGRPVCVYGTIARISSTDEVKTRFDFSQEPNTFFIFSATMQYRNPQTQRSYQVGECVRAEGEVGVYDEIPFINLRRDPVQPCQPGMQ
jgi:hypothetical protein